MKKSLFAGVLGMLWFAFHVMGEEVSTKPQVWMMPPSVSASDGRILRDLFQHPEQWAETRKKIDVLGCADWLLNKQFTDEELCAWLPLIDQWGLKLGLEVGAIKEWGPTGKEAFEKGSQHWNRIQSLGGKISFMAMDEPLICARYNLKKSDAYAIEETAQFIALVRGRYPAIRIGDVEGYPSISFVEHLAWIDALQARLKQMNVRGLDFYRLDVDWTHFIVHPESPHGSWVEVKKIEAACRERKIPFSLIYWAATQPALNQLGLSDDSTWYVGIMEQGYSYALVGGKPDEYVIESWIGIPSTAVPETADWTFTRSTLDFCNRFVQPKR